MECSRKNRVFRNKRNYHVEHFFAWDCHIIIATVASRKELIMIIWQNRKRDQIQTITLQEEIWTKPKLFIQKETRIARSSLEKICRFQLYGKLVDLNSDFETLELLLKHN